MSNEELMSAIDEELDNCIRKFRNAVYGEEVRAFITEYEELMIKKSNILMDEVIKEKHGKKRKRLTTVDDAKKESRHALYISVAALVVTIGVSVIRIMLLL